MKCKDVDTTTDGTSLEDDLTVIRTHLQANSVPMPSHEFFEQTRALCHAKLARPPVPKFIWAAFATLLLLSGVLMSPLAREISTDQPLSFPEIGVLILLLQNLLMLFLAPVLLQKIRVRKKDTKKGYIDKEVCHG